MSGVQRYNLAPDRDGQLAITPADDGELIWFTDHEAALAAARLDQCNICCEAAEAKRDKVWNAALDAAIGTGLAVEDVNRIEALRKSTSQPEPPCECWLCHDTNLTCDKCENCVVQAAAAQPEGGDRG